MKHTFKLSIDCGNAAFCEGDTPTQESAALEPSEFMILLCTGGPAVRIVGELNRGEPCRAWLEYQDWGTPWTRYFGADSDTLCQYASQFCFGEE
jgi:hypothetical protein